MHVQVGIIGAGPSGLMLAQLLHLQGVTSLILEDRDRAHVEGRIRAGVLEQGSVDLLIQAGVGDRLKREGLRHEGIEFLFGGARHRIDLADLTNGKAVTVYGQHEVVKDLIQARLGYGGDIRFEAKDVAVEDLTSDKPTIRWTENGVARSMTCDVIAGCDGFHGICRPSIPPELLTGYDRIYPFGWLGILAKAKPASEELIYANHADGFALLSMRSPEISRLYLQCPPDEDIARWSDDQIWDALDQRLTAEPGWRVNRGPILQKGITPMRSWVTEPMQHGRLFLVGDAAHIVPPTGAKGMNLALADVRILARALDRFFHHQNSDGLEHYSRTCLRRVWKAQRFSWWLTTLLHRFEDQGPFDARRQLAELDYVTSSRAGAMTIAENYVGLPFDE